MSSTDRRRLSFVVIRIWVHTIKNQFYSSVCPSLSRLSNNLRSTAHIASKREYTQTPLHHNILRTYISSDTRTHTRVQAGKHIRCRYVSRKTDIWKRVQWRRCAADRANMIDVTLRNLTLAVTIPSGRLVKYPFGGRTFRDGEKQRNYTICQVHKWARFLLKLGTMW